MSINKIRANFSGFRKPKTENLVFTVSLGCPKNLVDTEIMLGRLAQVGWRVTAAAQEADLLLVNTCAFIEPACKEAVNTILELAALKETDPRKRLVITGCLVQRFGPELARELPEVDLFLGVNDFPALADLLGDEPAPGTSRLHHEAPPYTYGTPQPRYPATPLHQAYLKIAEGCRHRCTYCTIPAIRGGLRSRPFDALISEASSLAAAGVKELVLVAQDTTSYGRDWGPKPALAQLLKELAAIDGFTWLRFLYGHPAYITDELLQVMADHSRILPYFDIPIQHGHEEILRRMGRGYSHLDIFATVTRIRQALPQAVLRTTVLVGFPGETENHADFLAGLVEEIGFHHLGIFLFSPEAGTPAASLDSQVPRREAQRRARRLKAIQSGIVKARLKALKGTVQKVMVDGVSPENDYLLTGRLPSQAPDIDGQVYLTKGWARPGEIHKVRVTRALPYDLVGELLAPADLTEPAA